MRIGLNLLYLLPGIVGGTETYAAGLLHGLAQIDKKNEFFVFVNKESSEWFIPQVPNFNRVICSVKAIKRYRRYFFEQFRLPNLLKEKKIDLVHSLGYVGPFFTPCPAVVTVPDLNYLAIGHTMPLYKRYLLRYFSSQAAKRAKAIITISNYSKSAICNELNIHSEKVFVTLLGPRWDRSDKPDNEVKDTLKIYGITRPYLAAFGGGSVHKNIPRLLQAFIQLKCRLHHQLLLIGHLPADVHPENLPADVIATGYVPLEHILPLLSGAEIFILPSLFEGFGLPVLEAQQAGVPVVCSMAGSLPEVAGEGAAYFDPYSVEDIAEKITRVARDTELCVELRQKGLANVQRFSWEQTARETLSVYTQVCTKRSQP